MPIKFKAKSKDEIPAELQSLYVERDGAFELDVDGMVDKTKHDEFRAQNVALRQQLEEHAKRFEGMDPDEFRKLAEEKRKLEEAQQLKDGEIEKVIDGRLRDIRTDWDKRLQKVASERDSLNTRLTAIQIDQGVTTVATKKGLRPTAIPDITARARTVFRLVNGVPAAFEADGRTVRVGKDGMTAMTLEEWVDTQVTDAPHLFETNSGGGAAGDASGGSGTARTNRSVKNPFRKETWNLTEQMKLQRTDPQLAARLKAAA
ncbi:MAG TPA: hypothetical protein VLT36_16420 [Candidatus Dormibacteraeota bacterium]|nr:hypothetical protein [Candidatus Dormibacteraeota bacterium]